jgi:hypothetical protein
VGHIGKLSPPLTGNQQPVNSASFSPDGKRISPHPLKKPQGVVHIGANSSPPLPGIKSSHSAVLVLMTN